MSATLAGITLGLHLVTWHAAPTYQQQHPILDVQTHAQIGSATLEHRYQNVNPGLYARFDNGLTVGTFRNSFDASSFYVARTFETPGKALALTLGAITGYPGRPVAPLVAPSLRVPLTSDTAARLVFLPRIPGTDGTHALHLALERSF